MSLHPETEELTALSDLEQPRRREVLEHVETCAACREVVAREDPSALFALLALEPLPELDLARLSRSIAAEVGRTRQSSRYAWRSIASVAAGLLLMATVVGWGLRDRPNEIAEGEPLPVDTAVTTPAAGLDPAGELPRILFPTAPEPGIELISTPGEARVVDVTAGDIQVVMIFDEALDI